MYLLNRAIVLTEVEAALPSIRPLEEAGQDPALGHYYLFDATLHEFHRRACGMPRARQRLEAARQKTHTPFDREIIDRRLAMCMS